LGAGGLRNFWKSLNKFAGIYVFLSPELLRNFTSGLHIITWSIDDLIGRTVKWFRGNIAACPDPVKNQ